MVEVKTELKQAVNRWLDAKAQLILRKDHDQDGKLQGEVWLLEHAVEDAIAAELEKSKPDIASGGAHSTEEVLGQLIDKCDNLLAAASLPLSASIHLEGMSGGIKEIREELKRLNQ